MIKTGDIVIYYTHLFGPIYGTIKETSKAEALFDPTTFLTEETKSKLFPKGLPSWINVSKLRKPQLIPSSA